MGSTNSRDAENEFLELRDSPIQKIQKGALHSRCTLENMCTRCNVKIHAFLLGSEDDSAYPRTCWSQVADRAGDAETDGDDLSRRTGDSEPPLSIPCAAQCDVRGVRADCDAWHRLRLGSSIPCHRKACRFSESVAHVPRGKLCRAAPGSYGSTSRALPPQLAIGTAAHGDTENTTTLVLPFLVVLAGRTHVARALHRRALGVQSREGNQRRHQRAAQIDHKIEARRRALELHGLTPPPRGTTHAHAHNAGAARLSTPP